MDRNEFLRDKNESQARDESTTVGTLLGGTHCKILVNNVAIKCFL